MPAGNCSCSGSMAAAAVTAPTCDERCHRIEASPVSELGRQDGSGTAAKAPRPCSGRCRRSRLHVADLLRYLRRHPPSLVLTCARGSSAHSATFGKHLVERHLGIPVAAFAPNIATIYRRRMRLERQLFLAVSQSGRSDDLIESAAMARAAGALTAAIVNDIDSPLARASDIVLPMAAGPELGVAATKTLRDQPLGLAACRCRMGRA